MLNRFGIGVRIDGVDVGPIVEEGGTIEYGRLSTFEQPEPPQCTLTFLTPAAAPQVPAMWPEFGHGEWSTASGFRPIHDTDDDYIGGAVKIYIGAPVWVAATTDSGFSADHDTQDIYDGAEYRRFTGRVVGIDWTTDRVVVTSVADIEQWSRVAMMAFSDPTFMASGDPPPWPDIEPDTVRAAWLAAQTPSPSTLHIDGAPGFDVAQYRQEDIPLCLAPALQDIARSTGGLFYADREGRAWFRSRNWTPPSILRIPPEITDYYAFGMELELGTVENDVTVTYREDTSSDGSANEVDAGSVTRYGTRQGMYDTILADSDAAHTRATEILAALTPAWDMPEVTLHMRLATDENISDLVEIDLGHHVRIPYLPVGSPVPSHDAQVIGYTEHLSTSAWEIELHLAPIPTGGTST
jgi:hypothetical protein